MDTNKYWIKRGKDYVNELDRSQGKAFQIQEKALIEVLKTIKPARILEIGCGYGRITKILTKYTDADITALDISPDQISLAKKNIERVNFVVGDFKNYNFGQNFDLVLASEVFLHIKPTEINLVLDKALKLARHWLIHIDPVFIQPKVLFPRAHNWSHDYLLYYLGRKDITSVACTPLSIGQYIFTITK